MFIKCSFHGSLHLESYHYTSFATFDVEGFYPTSRDILALKTSKHVQYRNNRGIYDQVKATEAYLRHFQSYMMKLYHRCLTAKYLTGLCLSYLSVQRKTDIKKVSDNLSHLLLSDKCY